MCIVICVYVGYSFKTERFALVWPVVFVRRVVSVLVSAFFTSTLEIILSSFNCNFKGPVPVLVKFTETKGEYAPCLEWPFSFSAGAGVVIAALFIPFALTVSLADFEPNSRRRQPLA